MNTNELYYLSATLGSPSLVTQGSITSAGDANPSQADETGDLSMDSTYSKAGHRSNGPIRIKRDRNKHQRKAGDAERSSKIQ